MKSALTSLVLEAQKTKVLDLSELALDSDDLQELAQVLPTIEGLVALEFYGCPVSSQTAPTLFSAIGKCSCLLHLALDACSLKDEEASILAKIIEQHSALLSLSLMNNNFSYHGAVALAELLEKQNSLLSLDLFGVELGISAGEEIQAALEENTSLLSMRLYNSGIEDATEERIESKLDQNRQFFMRSIENKSVGIVTIPKALFEHLKKITPSLDRTTLHKTPLLFIGELQESTLGYIPESSTLLPEPPILSFMQHKHIAPMGDKENIPSINGNSYRL